MSRPKFARALGALGMAGVLFGTHGALAFCQATTCVPSLDPGQCSPDAEKCLTVGRPLAWAGNCVTVSVQAAGAPKQHIDFAAALASVKRAFATWTSATCDTGTPAISVKVAGPITCDASEYNETKKNANIVIFREDTWPYAGGQDALGLTTIHFDPRTGEIWDADIEVNAVSEPLSAGDPSAKQVDLDSLLTHEAGHFLGLAHTIDSSATMFPGYQPGSTSLRTLAQDDLSGVCTLYPPGLTSQATSCEPRNGFSDLCGADQRAAPEATSAKGCSASRHGDAPSWLATVGVLVAFAWTRRRRSRPGRLASTRR